MDYQLLASQLRQPSGDFGRELAEKMNGSNRHITLRTIALLETAAGNSILEIGMGNGLFCAELLTRYPGTTYTGADFSATMVAEAQALNAAWVQAGRARFVLCDAAQLPFEDNSFDRIFTVNTLYFWETPGRELQELRRVLKPGGRLIISIRTEESMQALPFVQYGFRLYSEAALRQLLEEAGFGVEVICEPEPAFEGAGGQWVTLEALYGCCRKG